MAYLANLTRSPGDPRILQTGPSSLGPADRVARMLGWFSIGLGVAELVAPRLITRTFGMKGSETLVRAYGAREIGAGILSLGPEKQVGLWSRVAGDALDLATLATALRPGNRRRGAVGLALAGIAGVALLDLASAQDATRRHARQGGSRQRYADRSGFPRGLAQARGAAREPKEQAASAPV